MKFIKEHNFLKTYEDDNHAGYSRKFIVVETASPYIPKKVCGLNHKKNIQANQFLRRPF